LRGQKTVGGGERDDGNSGIELWSGGGEAVGGGRDDRNFEGPERGKPFGRSRLPVPRGDKNLGWGRLPGQKGCKNNIGERFLGRRVEDSFVRGRRERILRGDNFGWDRVAGFLRGEQNFGTEREVERGDLTANHKLTGLLFGRGCEAGSEEVVWVVWVADSDDFVPRSVEEEDMSECLEPLEGGCTNLCWEDAQFVVEKRGS
jgi:hypothetical protein